jgi:hypothetical protein
MSNNRKMDTEKVANLNNGILLTFLKNKDILSFAGKWIELGNIIVSEVIHILVSTYSKGHAWYVLTNKWVLAKMVENIQDTVQRTLKG